MNYMSRWLIGVLCTTLIGGVPFVGAADDAYYHPDTLTLLIKASEDPDPLMATEAVNSLGEIGSDKAKAAVIKALSSQEPVVVRAALVTLAQWKADPKVDQAIAAGLKHDTLTIQRATLAALAIRKSTLGVSAAARWAKENVDLRQSALGYLARVKPDNPEVGTALSHPPDANAALTGLILGKSIGSHKSTLETLLTSPHVALRLGALEALDVSKQLSVNAMKRALKDANTVARVGSFGVLGKREGSVKAFEPEILAALNHKNTALQAAGLQVAGKANTDGILNRTAKFMALPELAMRSLSKEALVGMSRDADVGKRIVDLLKHKDAGVRTSVAETLGQLAGYDSSQALIAALGDKDVKSITAIMDAIGMRRYTQAVDPLVNTLKGHAGDALHKKGTKLAYAAMYRGLYALARLGGIEDHKQTIKMWAEAAHKGKKPLPHAQAILALGTSKDPGLAGFYLKYYKHGSQDVRLAVSTALAPIPLSANKGILKAHTQLLTRPCIPVPQSPPQYEELPNTKLITAYLEKNNAGPLKQVMKEVALDKRRGYQVRQHCAAVLKRLGGEAIDVPTPRSLTPFFIMSLSKPN